MVKMANAEVRENVFVCEYDIIHQRPKKTEAIIACLKTWQIF